MRYKDVKEMSNEDLIEEFKGLWSVRYQTRCFGVDDILYEDELRRELNNRGFEVTENMEGVSVAK